MKKLLSLVIVLFSSSTFSQTNCRVFIEETRQPDFMAAVLRDMGYTPTASREGARFSVKTVEHDIVEPNYGYRCQDLIGLKVKLSFADKSVEYGPVIHLETHARKMIYQSCQGNQYDLWREIKRAYMRLGKKMFKHIPRCE